jgi:hypothetical protein
MADRHTYTTARQTENIPCWGAACPGAGGGAFVQEGNAETVWRFECISPTKGKLPIM